MQTQITCPQCGRPFTTEIHQIIDVGQEPQLKQLLLSGQLNMANCPHCGFSGPLNSIMLYHDPEHELLMVYVPQEMNLQQQQREQMIGSLTRRVFEQTPQEKRRAYMLAPPTMILTMQTFMEKVLETEGITPEMIARQQKQAELLNTLGRADKDVQEILIKQRGGEIDETFFAMLQQYIDMAQQMQDDTQLIPLINLRAKLMVETAVGRELEQRQIIMHGLNQEAKAAGGLTPQLLAKYVIEHQANEAILQQLVAAGASAMNYDFFTALTAEVESQKAAGNAESAERLGSLRDELLQAQEEMRQASQKMINDINDVIEAIMKAPDMVTAVREHASKIDDNFMYVLTMQIQQAEEQGQEKVAAMLRQVEGAIMKLAERSAPPEIQLLNQLVQVESQAEREKILEAGAHLLQPELVQVVDTLLQQVEGGGQQPEMVERLRAVKAMIAARV